jgi:hypothetical protein
MKHALITLIALATFAHADPTLWVYEKLPNKPGGIHHGLANGRPVLIQIYGENDIEQARQFGKYVCDTNVPLASGKEMIEAKANELYRGHKQMIEWFERDCAASYDEEKRRQ